MHVKSALNFDRDIRDEFDIAPFGGHLNLTLGQGLSLFGESNTVKEVRLSCSSAEDSR